MPENEPSRLTVAVSQARRATRCLLAGLAAMVNVTLGCSRPVDIHEVGGTVLVYELQSAYPGQQLDEHVADKTVPVVQRRLASMLPRAKRGTVNRVPGKLQIEIAVPRATDDDLKAVRRLSDTCGVLEFRIVADNRVDSDITSRATNPDEVEVKDTESDRTVARWVPFEKEETAAQFLSGSNSRFFAVRQRDNRTEILILIDEQNVTGDYLRNAVAGHSEGGERALHFSFNQQGANLFFELTSANLPRGDIVRHLSIVLDNQLLSAPTIRSAISGQGEITGGFTEKETQLLAEVLTAGALPARLTLVSETLISPASAKPAGKA